MAIKDNEELVNTLKKISPDTDEPPYPYHLTKAFSKGMWVVAAVGLWFANAHFFGEATLFSHFRSFFMGVIAVKLYGTIDDFIDLGVEIGAITEPDE